MTKSETIQLEKGEEADLKMCPRTTHRHHTGFIILTIIILLGVFLAAVAFWAYRNGHVTRVTHPGAITLYDRTGKTNLSKLDEKSDPHRHFVQFTMDYLESKYGSDAIKHGGLTVITTIDLNQQRLAADAIANPQTGIAAVRSAGGSNVAILSADPKTGQILAMIGSHDFNDPDAGQVNMTQTKRQPGSVFMPLVYAAAMKHNLGPGSTILDDQTNFGSNGGSYSPINADGKFHGVVSLRQALGSSLNIPAVKLLSDVGIPEVLTLMTSSGLKLDGGPDKYGLSLALGGAETTLNDLVNSYESFANGGVHYAPTSVLKVTDFTDKVLEDNTKPAATRAFDPQIAYLISDMLSDQSARKYLLGKTAAFNILGRKAAVKTAITERFGDAWTVGFTPDLVTGVWIGNNDYSQMHSNVADVVSILWNNFTSGALSAYPKSSSFTKPKGLQTLTLDADTGGSVTATTKTKHTDIFPSWYKAEK
ncbi:MAG TPA: penicillin-binding transpeptidase domain-containing protein [Candidatus Saccharimonadales bacterium]|nr:penicillin-binding transpeptidase domain-containing protein [Candidatus Saccharimonadales bacterium]